MKNLLLKIARLLSAALLISTATLALANDDRLSQAELDQMLAPVALYPDTVLTHVLIAATYPLEVVQAARWVKSHTKLNADEAVKAVEDKGWDPSVKALVAFPQLLERLSDDLEWTEQIGEAFLADEALVLARIQTLRQKAYANGTLNDNKHVVVEREREIIVIEPTRKEVIYVPVYDTRVVYGDWWWPSHPPVYWHTAGVYYRNSPFYWGTSVHVRPWFYFGIFDWHHRHVVVHHHYYHTPPRYYPKRHKHYVDARRWQHNTEHRRGVHYRHERLNRDYNAGYGYRQPTRQVQGKPVHQARHDKQQTREYSQQYQRKSAEQVRLPNREQQLHNNTQRQHTADATRHQTVQPQREIIKREAIQREPVMREAVKRETVQHQQLPRTAVHHGNERSQPTVVSEPKAAATVNRHTPRQPTQPEMQRQSRPHRDVQASSAVQSVQRQASPTAGQHSSREHKSDSRHITAQRSERSTRKIE